MSQRNLLLLLLATAISYACYVRGEQNPHVRYIGDGLDAITQGALESVSDQELFDGAMRGMVDVLARHGDEHSKFLPEAEADPLRTEIRQQFGGIGVRIGFEGKPPQLTIVGPPDPGTPAARADLLPGDHITAIDDRATAGMNMGDVLQLMRGEPGTTVRLSIGRPHSPQPRTVELVREIINIDSILGERRGPDGRWEFTLPDNPRIAHVRIASFGERTAAELNHVLETLQKRGVKSIVLDLRDNVGGSLDAAVAVCQILLPAGKEIVTTRGRGQQIRQRYATTVDGKFTGLPLVVLVNQNSASAAEIVAACLQDHGRAPVAGQRTYGKGTVQELLPMESGRSLLKLTWASFWRPNGANIHRRPGDKQDSGWGVTPDAGLERTLSDNEYAAWFKYRSRRDGFSRLESEQPASNDVPAEVGPFIDEQLQSALQYLESKLKTLP
jgi:carboxyl-terminal processing protease